MLSRFGLFVCVSSPGLQMLDSVSSPKVGDVMDRAYISLNFTHLECESDLRREYISTPTQGTAFY